jgi:ABC-type phosphate/phosphonate transport system substrate-binding protein
MRIHIGKGLAVVVLAGCWFSTLTQEPVRAEELGHASRPVQIGMVSSLFRDVPDSLIDTMAKPFGMMMSAQTGMSGQIVKGGPALDLAQQLDDGKVHIGIFHGFEFAWVKEKHPRLAPLAIAVNQTRHLKAFLVVKWDSDIAGFGDLREKTLNVPRGTRGHCHLFMESRCQQAGQCTPPELVGTMTNSNSAEEALDEIVDGTADAALIDNVALESYRRRKPGRFSELKIALESEVFPTGVVVYRQGSFDEKTLSRFRDGLLNTHKNFMGRQMLTLWKLTCFEAVPADYQQSLQEIIKAYPAPAAKLAE